ncbi:MAG: hypothetical protein E7184_01435 [Erysipelotrichaceae bacterium]|nr:hypothetical protein [Erysipelotrichaceae bacterium]
MSMPWFLGILPSMEEITAAIGDWIALAFFWLIKIVFQIMDVFMDIIFQLAGLKNIGGTNKNILSTFFSNDSGGSSSNSISQLYFYICLVCIVLMLFLAVVSIIKQDFFSEEPAKSHAPIFKRMVTGLLYFIAIPPIFVFSVEIVAGLMSALMQIESFSVVESLSQTIFELSLTEPEWMKIDGGVKLDPIPHWSVVEAKDFVALTNTYDFNWLIFIGVIGMSFYSLFMIAFGLVKRVFSLVLLYVLGPIAISQSVLDGGNKMKNWKDNVIKEFISIFGTIIGLVVFFMFITEVVSDLTLFNANSLSGIARTAALLGNTVVKAMFILVGFSVIKSGGGGYIAQAIGANLSIDDGKNAFHSMKEATKFAAAPFKQVGKTASSAAKFAKGAVVKTGKAINFAANKDVRQEWWDKKRPTLDAFRSEGQLEKIKAQRQTIKDAQKAALDNPNDKRLQQIAKDPKALLNDVTGSEGILKEFESKLAAFGAGTVGKLNGVDGSLIADIKKSLTGATTGDYKAENYTNIRKSIDDQINEKNNALSAEKQKNGDTVRNLNGEIKQIEMMIQAKISSLTEKNATPEQINAATAALNSDLRSKQDELARVTATETKIEKEVQILKEVRTEVNSAEDMHGGMKKVSISAEDLKAALDKGGTAGRAEQTNAGTKMVESLKAMEDMMRQKMDRKI